ncbi:MAG: hypothetical protein IKR73_09120 [Oscillospiraceae bacterium]|nr:hypothetical protein [Oscillospiraceae bacterium]
MERLTGSHDTPDRPDVFVYGEGTSKRQAQTTYAEKEKPPKVVVVEAVSAAKEAVASIASDRRRMRKIGLAALIAFVWSIALFIADFPTSAKIPSDEYDYDKVVLTADDVIAEYPAMEITDEQRAQIMSLRELPEIKEAVEEYETSHEYIRRSLPICPEDIVPDHDRLRSTWYQVDAMGLQIGMIWEENVSNGKVSLVKLICYDDGTIRKDATVYAYLHAESTYINDNGELEKHEWVYHHTGLIGLIRDMIEENT